MVDRGGAQVARHETDRRLAAGRRWLLLGMVLVLVGVAVGGGAVVLWWPGHPVGIVAGLAVGWGVDSAGLVCLMIAGRHHGWVEGYSRRGIEESEAAAKAEFLRVAAAAKVVEAEFRRVADQVRRSR